MNYTRIWAHRGASAYAPENTMPAFELADKMNSDGIEIDVHSTVDGTIVVCHDHLVDRTSNGQGAFAKMTFEEVRELDFGHPTVFGDKFKGTKISTLAEVYDFIKSTNMSINVEIKGNGNEYVKRVYDVANYVGLDNERIIFSSFYHPNLTHLLEIDSKVYTAPLYDRMEGDNFEYAKGLGSYALHPSYPQIFESVYIQKAHENGFMINPWTVDSPEAMSKLLALGADALITNKPDIAIQMRRIYQSHLNTAKK